MKLLNVKATNFGSYTEVEYEGSDTGLTLISGPTGSGKSTLPDMVSWCLYGVTAKDTNIADVCSWGDGGHTSVSVTIQLHSGKHYTILRSRRGNVSDLFYQSLDTAGAAEHRGRNSVETQQHICELLGVSALGFLSAGYLCEQSPCSRFFLSNAKERRAVLDLVTDLSVPSLLASRISEQKKKLKVHVVAASGVLSRLQGALDQATSSVSRLKKQAAEWDTEHAGAISAEHQKSTHFETLKASKVAALKTKAEQWDVTYVAALDALVAKIDAADALLSAAEKKASPCATCGVSKGAERIAELQGKIELLAAKYQSTGAEENPYTDQITRAEAEENRAEERITALQAQTNPHRHYLTDLSARCQKQETELAAKQAEVADLSAQISVLDQLNDLSFALRGVLLENSVSSLQDKTNALLETYFDSEFRVSFDASAGDAIEVSINKSGYDCTFRQLSKGQRQLLRLCFSIAVMDAVANTTGTHIDTVFMDEPLDGMDEVLKLRAFGLLEAFAKNHSSVFVIDHTTAFQELFTNVWTVEMTGGGSVLNR